MISYAMAAYLVVYGNDPELLTMARPIAVSFILSGPVSALFLYHIMLAGRPDLQNQSWLYLNVLKSRTRRKTSREEFSEFISSGRTEVNSIVAIISVAVLSSITIFIYVLEHASWQNLFAKSLVVLIAGHVFAARQQQIEKFLFPDPHTYAITKAAILIGGLGLLALPFLYFQMQVASAGIGALAIAACLLMLETPPKTLAEIYNSKETGLPHYALACFFILTSILVAILGRPASYEQAVISLGAAGLVMAGMGGIPKLGGHGWHGDWKRVIAVYALIYVSLGASFTFFILATMDIG